MSRLSSPEIGELKYLRPHEYLRGEEIFESPDSLQAIDEEIDLAILEVARDSDLITPGDDIEIYRDPNSGVMEFRWGPKVKLTEAETKLIRSVLPFAERHTRSARFHIDELREISAPPEQQSESMKENLRWAGVSRYNYLNWPSSPDTFSVEYLKREEFRKLRRKLEKTEGLVVSDMKTVYITPPVVDIRRKSRLEVGLRVANATLSREVTPDPKACYGEGVLRNFGRQTGDAIRLLLPECMEGPVESLIRLRYDPERGIVQEVTIPGQESSSLRVLTPPNDWYYLSLLAEDINPGTAYPLYKGKLPQ